MTEEAEAVTTETEAEDGATLEADAADMVCYAIIFRKYHEMSLILSKIRFAEKWFSLKFLGRS